MKARIYLDNNATTVVDPLVLQAIIQTLQSCPGNPSSIHQEGREARQTLIAARQSIASAIQAKPKEILFTSGGTEGLNAIVRGLFQSDPHLHIITSNAEHASVYNTLQVLKAQGADVTFLPVGSWGAVQPQAVKDALKPSTKLIALMAVNNETGVKTDIEAIASIAEAARIFFLVDGIALLGKEPFSIPSGVSAMCFSGHKLHGPKGVGFLVWRAQRQGIAPLLTGGNQEFGLRAGTENLAGIVGLATAITLLRDTLPEATETMRLLRDRLEKGILSRVPSAIVNGEGPRIVNTSNISFQGMEGEVLLMNLDSRGIAVSHGSACSSGAIEPSRILLNMGIPIARARSAVRFSVSRFTTEAEIDYCIETVASLVNNTF
jgi:cysteine desulfurase